MSIGSVPSSMDWTLLLHLLYNLDICYKYIFTTCPAIRSSITRFQVDVFEVATGLLIN